MAQSEELEAMGYKKVYDYTQYSHQNHCNVIPEEDFKHLVTDTFSTITDVLRRTYGPYGSTVMLSNQSQTLTTKDGYNVFEGLSFSHQYKRMVYLAIQKIIDRVNNNVGDGTTSCILLAEKIFNKLNTGVKRADDKRNILKTLSEIESLLQDSSLLEKDKDDVSDDSPSKIRPVTGTALRELILMSSNGDEKLMNVLMEAFQPVFEDTDSENPFESPTVLEVRNVNTNVIIDPSSDTEYQIQHLPGDYRVGISIDDAQALRLSERTTMKIALYDHAFTSADWVNLTQNHDKETLTLVIARGFNRNFMDNEWFRYIQNRALVNAHPAFILVEMRGSFVRDEIQDLGAVLHVKPFNMANVTVNYDTLPTMDISVHNKNVLCFYDCEPVSEEYIETVKFAMDNDESKSVVRHNSYQDRIKALNMHSADTIILVTASSTLEAKMITDKIDDCVSIVNSAIRYGVVPNMLRYGYNRINRIMINNKKKSLNTNLYDLVCESIKESIQGLFSDIWYSKYVTDEIDEIDEVEMATIEEDLSTILKEFYNELYLSFDIIDERYMPNDELCTSAQYDIEVISASISIVKYLLTSRAFIFDAALLRPHGDEGTYKLQN